MEKKQKRADEILKSRSKHKRDAILLNVFRYILLSVGIISLIAFVGIISIYFHLIQELPKISSLSDYRPPVITTIYSDDDRKIGEFFKERRIVIPISEMPEMLLNAFISAEDDRFYQHKGIDFFSIIRALIKNIEAGSIVQGGSTITQQVAKSFFLTPKKSYNRKMKEAILAYRIDKAFTKKQILYLYLNQIYLGHGAYGVEAAAENYFGKSAKELSLAECAILAGLPRAPSWYSPFNHQERAKRRQVYVLNRMVSEKYITNIEATEALNEELKIVPQKNWYTDEVPYYAEYVRQYVENKYGKHALFNDGLKVYTSVNIEMQKNAHWEIEAGLRDLDKRQGYRGPIQHLEATEIETFSIGIENELYGKTLEVGNIVKGVVIEVDNSKKLVMVRIGENHGVIPFENMKWALNFHPKAGNSGTKILGSGQFLEAGDVIEAKIVEKNDIDKIWILSLEQTPAVQSALLCIESETGHVKAMVGGRSFKESQFNRAIQSRRQPGSAFKPIIYAAALDKGYTSATVIYDTAVVYEDSVSKSVWKPKNYNKQFYGPTRLREALTHSRNLVSIKILKDIGIDYTIDYARKLGITSNLSRDLSLALGSSGISLLEMVNAYSVFANMGYRVEPVFVRKILDRNGKILEQAGVQREKVIEKSTAYIVTSMLESVVQEGTGRRVRALNRPVAGKTGTTNDFIDAWFIGYTPRYITGTWVGFDQEKSMGKNETGSSAAAPIWLGFMQKTLDGKPVRVFKVPEDVIFANIDSETGLLPIPESKKTIEECFKRGTAPTQKTKKPDTVTSTEDFFKSGM